MHYKSGAIFVLFEDIYFIVEIFQKEWDWMEKWGVHATITTSTEKVLSMKAYELDVGFRYWIVSIYNLLFWNAVHY